MARVVAKIWSRSEIMFVTCALHLASRCGINCRPAMCSGMQVWVSGTSDDTRPRIFVWMCWLTSTAVFIAGSITV
jgi:hypothetical protein